jgi:hypothetical protein
MPQLTLILCSALLPILVTDSSIALFACLVVAAGTLAQLVNLKTPVLLTSITVCTIQILLFTFSTYLLVIGWAPKFPLTTIAITTTFILNDWSVIRNIFAKISRLSGISKRSAELINFLELFTIVMAAARRWLYLFKVSLDLGLGSAKNSYLNRVYEATITFYVCSVRFGFDLSRTERIRTFKLTTKTIDESSFAICNTIAYFSAAGSVVCCVI